MKSLKFKKLSILSTTEQKGGYYEFGENLNLITSDSNSYGKSAIIKMLLWTLGCEPFFDDDWKNLKCKSIVSFTILETTFTFQRILNNIWVQVNDYPVEHYDKITGDYSIRFAGIVNFPALLPSYSHQLEVPPPAYYFTPFYIEQWKGWVSSFMNFENLTQYPNWEKPIIQTHVGILKKEYYDLEVKINEKKFEKENQKESVDKYDTTLEIIGAIVPETILSISEKEFSVLTSQLQNDLVELTRKQELTLNDLAIQEGEKSYLQSQYEIVRNNIEDLQLDYDFASTELEDELVCPVCGTIHENSMDSRLDFLKDKSKMEDLAKDLKDEISKYEHELIETRKSLDNIKNNIKMLQDKYIIENKDNNIDLENVIESYSSKSLRLKINTSRSTSLSAIHDIDIDIKSFKIDQKDTKNGQKGINRDFINYLIEFFKKVDVESLLSEKTKEPTDFKTLGKQGSEADKIRSRLAYYIALYSLINKHSQEIISPLIVDTPQQQDQSDRNYKSMLDLISDSTPKDSQIFLCAVDKPVLSDFKKKSHVIHVGEKQVISTKQFNDAKAVFDRFETAIILS